MTRTIFVLVSTILFLGCSAKPDQVLVTEKERQAARTAGSKAVGAVLDSNDHQGMEAKVVVSDHIERPSEPDLQPLLPPEEDSFPSPGQATSPEPEELATTHLIENTAPDVSTFSQNVDVGSSSPESDTSSELEGGAESSPRAGEDLATGGAEDEQLASEMSGSLSVPEELVPVKVVFRAFEYDNLEPDNADLAGGGEEAERTEEETSAPPVPASSPRADERVSKLIDDLLEHENMGIRLAAVQELAGLEVVSERVLAAITQALGDQDKTVAVTARGALQKIGPPAVATLVDALQHGSPPVRVGAIRALSRFDRELITAALSPLVEALARGDDDIRAAAATALGHMDFDVNKVVPPLIRSLDDQSRLVKENAARALGTIGPPARAAISTLRRVERDDDYWVRVSAKQALRSIDPAPPKPY